MGSEIVSTFRKTGSITTNELLKAGKPLLKASISAVKVMANGLLRLVKELLTKIADIGNAEINIPIFSWLYKKIAGHPLTLFDAISLIIAIPTTIFAKIITGKTPPTFNNMNASLLKELAEDGDVSDSLKYDWAVFSSEVAVGITLTTGIISTIKLLYKFAKGDMDGIMEELDDGPSSFFDLFGIVVDIVGCFMSIPESAEMPGASYRYAVSLGHHPHKMLRLN